MQYSDDADELGLDDVERAVRELAEHGSANLAANPLEQLWILTDKGFGFSELGHEFDAKPITLLFVPAVSVVDVGKSTCPENDPTIHAPPMTRR